MPKKVSKSVSQKVSQKVKQTVNINVPIPLPRKRRVIKPRIISPSLNTGTMLSSTIVPAGYYTSQIGRTINEPIPQIHHKFGRMERTIDDLLSNVSDTRYIKADPKPIVRPIDEPVAYDSGFINRSETPMPFLDNSIRRAPINMENIPIPNQGMYERMYYDYFERLRSSPSYIKPPSIKKEEPMAYGGGGMSPASFSDNQIDQSLSFMSPSPDQPNQNIQFK